MRIDGVYLKGVGPFREVKIHFQPRRSTEKADVHVLVGPNGSGKSTVLYAMAAALGGWFLQTGGRQAVDRMARQGSTIALLCVDHAVALTWSGASATATLLNPFGGAPLSVLSDRTGYSWLSSTESLDAPFFRYLGHAGAHVRAGGNPASLASAAFAYSGSRSLREYSFSAIEEPTDGPLAESLSFDKTVDARRLAQWLSATFAKRALARERSDAEDARRYGTAIERIEEAVSEVTGDAIRLGIDYKPRFRIIVERHGRALDLDLLPDGLKSILSWIADLLMRLDRIPWENDVPLLERPFVLLLDEIDIHLHPAWQRRVLPMVQRLFPNAQIFVTTHSPFVVSSVSDAWVYPLDVDERGEANALAAMKSQAGTSFRAVVKSIFGVEEEFDEETEAGLRDFYALRERVLSGEAQRFDDLQALGGRLADRGVEVRDIVSSELLRVARRTGQRP
jgi:predicted ATP-binding protein involved in virulence